jgi:hypothetical protein
MSWRPTRCGLREYAWSRDCRSVEQAVSAWKNRTIAQLQESHDMRDIAVHEPVQARGCRSFKHGRSLGDRTITRFHEVVDHSTMYVSVVAFRGTYPIASVITY